MMQLDDVQPGQMVVVNMRPDRYPYLLRAGGFQGSVLRVFDIIDGKVRLISDKNLMALMIDPSEITPVEL